MNHPYDAMTLAELRERRSMKWNAFDADVLPAWVAEMDYPIAEPVRMALLDMANRSDTGYAWSGGFAEAFAEFSTRRYGFEPDVGRIAVLQDIMRGVMVALYQLTPPGSGIAFLLPAYPPFFEVVDYTERRVVGVPMVPDNDGVYQLDFERLEATLARPDVSAFLLCNPQNPTGRVFTRTELTRIAELANRHDVLMMVDEVHGPLTYPAANSGANSAVGHVPYASLGESAANSVTFVSASKGWNLPGLKCAGVLAGSARTWAAFADLPIEIQVGASPFGIAANIAAFRQGEAWLDDTVAYLDGNRQALAGLLAERLPGVGYAVPEATYLAWLDCRALGLGDDPTSAFLERGRVALNPGTDYGTEVGRGFVRLNFGTSRAILTEAVDRMAGAVQGVRPG